MQITKAQPIARYKSLPHGLPAALEQGPPVGEESLAYLNDGETEIIDTLARDDYNRIVRLTLENGKELDFLAKVEEDNNGR